MFFCFFFFFSSRRRHTRFKCDWSSDVCSSDLHLLCAPKARRPGPRRASIVAPGRRGTLKPARRGGAKMREVVILSAVRTPIGRFLGGLSTVPAPRLGAVAIKAALERAGVAPDQGGEGVRGNVLSAGIGQAPARQAAMAAGAPETVPATTAHKMCGSGLKSVM